MYEHGIRVKVDIKPVDKIHKKDKFIMITIMERLRNTYNTIEEVIQINQCYLFLQAMNVVDIVTGDRTKISVVSLNGVKMTGRTRDIKGARQGNISQFDGRLWQRVLADLCFIQGT